MSLPFDQQKTQSGNSIFETIYVYDKLNGNVTGNVTGNLTGNVVGNLTGDVSGNVTGNVDGDVNAGIVTATTYYGDGSNLSGINVVVTQVGYSGTNPILASGKTISIGSTSNAYGTRYISIGSTPSTSAGFNGDIWYVV